MALHLSRVSLATGSQNLLTTTRYLLEFGPTVVSLQSMLRTAIWGGAQAVWLLSPAERGERVSRGMRVYYYSQMNHKKWLNTFDENDPRTAHPEALARIIHGSMA